MLIRGINDLCGSYAYVYIYTCVCVCVCVFVQMSSFFMKSSIE